MTKYGRENGVIFLTAILAKLLLFFVELLPKALMSPLDYGEFSFYLATTVVLTALFSYGGQNIAVKEFSDSNVGINTFYNAILIPFLIFLIFIPIHFIFNLNIISIVTALLLSLVYNTSAYYRCVNRVSSWYIYKDIFRSLIFMLTLIVSNMVNDGVSYNETVIFFCTSLCISLPFCFKNIGLKSRLFLSFINIENIKSYFKKATPIIFTGFTYMVLSRMDIAFVRKYEGLAVLGDYSSISRISYQALFIQQIVLSKALPTVAKSMNSKMYMKSFQYAHKMCMLITVSTFICSAIIFAMLNISAVTDFFKYSIDNVITVASIFLVGHVIISSLSFNSYFLLYTNNQHYGYFNNSFVIIFAGLGYYFIVPIYGVVGAALTTIIALILGNILEFIEFNFFIKPKLFLKQQVC